METKQITRPFEIKEISDDGTFSGYGSVFGVLDSYSDIVKKGAFKRSLKEHKAANTAPKLLWQHDTREPIGVWQTMKEDDVGLYVEGKLLKDVRRGFEAYALLKAGALDGLSIGFMAVKDNYDHERGVRTLVDVDLWEVSLVTFGANPSALVESVKAADQIKTIREFEDFLRDVGGFSQYAAKSIAIGGFKAMSEHRDDDGISELTALLKRNVQIIKQ